MVDKVKPLKLESSSTGGTENDLYPHELDPTEDYVAAKGVAFENSDNTLIQGVSGQMQFKDSDVTTMVSLYDIYTGDGGNVARFYRQLLAQSNVSNNQWISYSSNLPDLKVIMTTDATLKEIAWDNSSPNVEFDLQVYKNGIVDPTNIVYTLDVNSPNSGSGLVTNLNINLVAGDWLRFKYIDIGTNCQDLGITLGFLKLPT